MHNKVFFSFDFSALNSEQFRKLHFNCSASRYYFAGLKHSSYNHNGIIKTSLRLFKKLLCSSSKKNSCSFALWTLGKNIVSFFANSFLFKKSTKPKKFWSKVRNCGLYLSTCSLFYSPNIFLGNSSCTENIPISKILCGKITNWQLRQNNISSTLMNLIKLVINYFPLSINNALELFWIFYSYFSTVFFSLEFKLYIKKYNFCILKSLWLLLKSCI